jgi:hypothetical protein
VNGNEYGRLGLPSARIEERCDLIVEGSVDRLGATAPLSRGQSFIAGDAG